MRGTLLIDVYWLADVSLRAVTALGDVLVERLKKAGKLEVAAETIRAPESKGGKSNGNVKEESKKKK